MKASKEQQEIPADEPIVKTCHECSKKPSPFILEPADQLFSCPQCGRLWANGEFLTGSK